MVHQKIIWTPEAQEAFVNLKTALQTTPTLGLPDMTKPFTQSVSERNCYMDSVLSQEHGGEQRPVAYFSSKLDSVAQGLPAVAAAEKAIIASRELVG